MIGLIGVSFKTAPVEIREQLSFSVEESKEFINSLVTDKTLEGIIVLSTCNRTEIYFNLSGCCEKEITRKVNDKFLEFKGVEKDAMQKYLYIKSSREAIKHLFMVVSGLDSMVLGEDQIVVQIKEAFKMSEEMKVADKVLTKLYHKALETGKHIRTNTGIAKGATSVSYAAVEKCSSLFDDLSKRKILLIGTGETGELVLKSLKKKGNSNVTITNRTYEKASRMAHLYGCNVVPIDEKLKHILDADIIMTSTSSPHYLLTKEMMEQAMKARNFKPVVLVDLSVPRDIQDCVNDVKNVSLFNVDHLEEAVLENQEKRAGEVKKSEVLVDTFVDAYQEWLSTLRLSPAILSIKNTLSAVNQGELNSFKKKFSDDEYELIQKYGNHITQKYIRQLIKTLKDVTENGKKPEHIDFVRELFESEVSYDYSKG